MKDEEVKSNLCSYNPRNPDYDEEFAPAKDLCFCDNCFYGRTKLAEEILNLKEIIKCQNLKSVIG